MTAGPLILFDLGGVLLENATFEKLSFLLQEPTTHQIVKARWLASPAVRSFELGELAANDFALAFIGEWEIDLAPAAFLREFESWPSGFYPGVAETLSTLRRNYRVGCLSNSNEVHWRKFNGFSDYFDFALSSHLLGAIKPDDDAYLRALHRCGVAPSDVRFFDDQLINVETARRLGIDAYHVEGMAQLLPILHSEGLLGN